MNLIVYHASNPFKDVFAEFHVPSKNTAIKRPLLHDACPVAFWIDKTLTEASELRYVTFLMGIFLDGKFERVRENWTANNQSSGKLDFRFLDAYCFIFNRNDWLENF